MARRLLDGLLVLIVHLIDRLRLLILCHRLEAALAHRRVSDIRPVFRIVGDPLRENILGSFHGFLRRGNAFLLGDIIPGRIENRAFHLLKQD